MAGQAQAPPLLHSIGRDAGGADTPKVKPVNAMRRAAAVKNGPAGTGALPASHQLSLVGAAPLLHAHPGRPLPQYAGKRRQPVLHPDIVAMEPVDKAWGKHVKACGHASGSTCVRLWSFEVKKTLTVANIRKCFFQAVSNSSWAHEGYLVATAIADDRVEQELRMLSALHGIGVILLDPENPSESEILLPAQKKPDATGNPLIASPKKTETSTSSLSWFPSTSKPGRCGKRIGTTRRPDESFV